MRTLCMMLAETMLNEKTSDIRRFKQLGKNPPEWAKDFVKKYPDASSWKICDQGINELASAFGWKLKIYSQIKLKDILDDMYKKYLNEFIDEENVPVNVGCWMLEDILKNQTNKLKTSYLIDLANYLNNEVHWVMHK